MLKIKKILIRTVYGLLIYIVTIIVLGYIGDLIVKINVPVHLPSFSIYESKDFVSVEGTWVIEGDDQYSPLQTSKIKCDHFTNQCKEAQGSISPDDYSFLKVELDTYDIVEWTDQHLTYVNNNPLCVFYRYTIDWSTKSVTGIRVKRKDKVNDKGCEGLKDELRITLKDGLEVYLKQDEKYTPKIISQLLHLLLFWT